MADKREVETEEEPPTLDADAVGLVPHEDHDASILLAAAKVMATHERCVRMYRCELPRDGTFARSAQERRDALFELVAIPASGSAACGTKLNVLTEMLPWFQGEDPDLFNCFVTYSREVTALLQINEARVHTLTSSAHTGTSTDRVRWLLSVAAAVPGLLTGRWDSGGVG